MKEIKKTKKSFRDLSPREYMYFPKGTLESGKTGKFSRSEIFHILIAMGVLTLSFSFTISQNNILSGFKRLDSFPSSIIVAFLGIVTAFFVHEIFHKFMAQKYGLWSEFRMYPQGLFISLILAFLTGFVFAAPGAVMFRGETRNFETGRIAVAGPTANIIIAVITFILYRNFFSETDLGKIFAFISLVNVLLATFNLLPFRPLDGSKVIRWNGIIWSILLIISIILLVLIYEGGIPQPINFL
jgi:Zn-dependent protease